MKDGWRNDRIVRGDMDRKCSKVKPKEKFVEHLRVKKHEGKKV